MVDSWEKQESALLRCRLSCYDRTIEEDLVESSQTINWL